MDNCRKSQKHHHDPKTEWLVIAAEEPNIRQLFKGTYYPLPLSKQSPYHRTGVDRERNGVFLFLGLLRWVHPVHTGNCGGLPLGLCDCLSGSQSRVPARHGAGCPARRVFLHTGLGCGDSVHVSCLGFWCSWRPLWFVPHVSGPASDDENPQNKVIGTCCTIIAMIVIYWIISFAFDVHYIQRFLA